MSTESTLTSWHSAELDAHALMRWAHILSLFSSHMQQSTMVFQGTVSTQTGSFHRLGRRQTHKLRKWLPSPWTDSPCQPDTSELGKTCTLSRLRSLHLRHEEYCPHLRVSVKQGWSRMPMLSVLIPLFPQPMSTNKKWCSKNMVGPARWLS